MAVKNRIAGTAHTTNLVEHGIVSDKLIEYHAACAARGGRPHDTGPGFSDRPRETHPAARTIC
jgi:2,4-dienoyl-CoA reductase-like NADH-dependent reductase (Old Yellow Enzyme family)